MYKEAPDGYYLVEFTGVPFVEQEDDEEVNDKGSLKCHGFLVGDYSWCTKMV